MGIKPAAITIVNGELHVDFEYEKHSIIFGVLISITATNSQ